MQNFMITLLTCSVAMSTLALFYMAITPLLAKRYSEKGRYYAWLIIIIGLIIPFRPQFDNAIVKVAIPNETVAPVNYIGNEIPIVVTDVNTALSPITPDISWWWVIAVVWLSGSVIFLAYHTVKHWQFVKMVKRWRENITDEHTLTLFQELKKEMRIPKKINLYLCSCVGSPMMIGLINPQILLPKANLVQDELCFILKHELVHFKRKDLLYKYSVLVAAVIHWFNPIVYLTSKAIDVLCETSCDTEVIRSMDMDTRQHYSETIIGVVKYHSKVKTALSTNFYGGKKGMKKRISSIMDMSNKKVGVAIICAVLITTLGTGFAFAADTQAEVNSDFRWPFSKLIEQNRKDDTARVFEEYSQYGLVYNKDTDRLYFNGELVRYFEDIISESYYKRWLSQDGVVDVYVLHNASGDLASVEAFSQQAFNERTPLLEDEIYALSITNSITKTKTTTNTQTEYKSSLTDNSLYNEYYTEEMEQVKKNILEQAYEIYRQFGLTYDKVSDSLSYNGKAVGYFEDKSLYRFFGNSESDGIEIYALRDDTGNLTRLEVRE